MPYTLTPRQQALYRDTCDIWERTRLPDVDGKRTPGNETWQRGAQAVPYYHQQTGNVFQITPIGRTVEPNILSEDHGHFPPDAPLLGNPAKVSAQVVVNTTAGSPKNGFYDVQGPATQIIWRANKQTVMLRQQEFPDPALLASVLNGPLTPGTLTVTPYPTLRAGTLTVSSPTSTSLSLAVTGASGGTPPYQYLFQISRAGLGAWANVGDYSAAISALATGLDAGTAYDVRCLIKDAAGGQVATDAKTQATLAELAMGAVVPGAHDSDSVILSWTVSGGTPVYTYQVQYKRHADSVWLDFGLPITATTVEVTGLTFSTSYDFQVTVTDGLGETDASTVVTQSTDALPALIAPTLNAPTAHTANSVSLSWGAALGGLAPYSYQPQKSLDGSSWSNAGSATSSLSATASGLLSGTTYLFRVIVTDALSSTATSNTQSQATDFDPAQAAGVAFYNDLTAVGSSAVSSLANQSTGSMSAFSQATGAKQMTGATGTNGAKSFPIIKTTGSGQWYGATGGPPSSRMVHLPFRLPGGTGASIYGSAGGTGPNAIIMAGTDQQFVFNQGGVGGLHWGTAWHLLSEQWLKFPSAVTVDATSYAGLDITYQDGVANRALFCVADRGDAAWELNAINNGFNPTNPIEMGRLHLTTGYQDVSTLANLLQGANTTYGFTCPIPATGILLAANGDSTTASAGFAWADGIGWPGRVLAILSGRILLNLAVGGQRIGDASSTNSITFNWTASGKEAYVLLPRAKRTIYCVQGGINDFATQAVTSAQLIARFTSVMQLALAQGAFVCLVSPYPSINFPGWETVRQDVIAWMKSTAAGNPANVAYLNVGEAWTPTDAANSALFPDGTHPVGAVYDADATRIAPALAAVYALLA